MTRILVADDEEGVRSFIAEALELDGHEVVQVADGGQAAEALLARSFDVLVTDLKMPVLDGMSLLRRVRAGQPDIEVIVVTAHGTVDTAVEAMKQGAFEYLQKPLSGPAEVRLVVARALERRALLAIRDRAGREEPAPEQLTWGDPAMTEVVSALRKVAKTEATVLLTGESGTGKEVAARALHGWSGRAEGPFVAVNCASLSESLLESELFGHEKGAFTGATSLRRGRLELAAGGTFFLAEVGELKPELQAKLLRVLQERRFERVGGARSLDANVRWIAATNRDLRAMIASGRFREDLYHRIAVFPIHIPPLRDRRGDLPRLAETLLRRIGDRLGRPSLSLDEAAMKKITTGRWPGNARELANALERAAILAEGEVLAASNLWIEGEPPAAQSGAPVRDTSSGLSQVRPLAEVERDAIEQALSICGGNRTRAAEQLGIGLRTLYDKLKRYGFE